MWWRNYSFCLCGCGGCLRGENQRSSIKIVFFVHVRKLTCNIHNENVTLLIGLAVREYLLSAIISIEP